MRVITLSSFGISVTLDASESDSEITITIYNDFFQLENTCRKQIILTIRLHFYTFLFKVLRRNPKFQITEEYPTVVFLLGLRQSFNQPLEFNLF